jgi:hypothetical protein
VACDGALRCKVQLVTMTFADGKYSNPILAEANDAEHLAWAALVEPAFRLAMELHIL